VLSNRKEARRRGKIQLIDATTLKFQLRKNLGQKNCELTPELREQIVKLYLDFEDNEYSKIFDNSAFGYWKVTVLRPQYEKPAYGRILGFRREDSDLVSGIVNNSCIPIVTNLKNAESVLNGNLSAARMFKDDLRVQETYQIGLSQTVTEYSLPMVIL